MQFLRQCLDGFIIQKTSFRFNVFVHDDASTDGSDNIILEYARKYPDLIIPYIEKENLYSKRDGSFIRTTLNTKFLKGKYIALCEGDDYWTDPLKLQKQVDYMESHPECSMCFGNAIEHWEDGAIQDRAFSSLQNRVYGAEELCRNWKVATATFLFRKDILNTELYKRVQANKKMVAGDLPLVLTCAHFGSLYAFSDFFSVYRRHNSGFTINLNSTRRTELGEFWEEIPHLFGQSFTDDSLFYAIYHYRSGIKAAIKEGNLSRARELYRRIILFYLLHPIAGLKRLIKIINEKHP